MHRSPGVAAEDVPAATPAARGLRAGIGTLALAAAMWMAVHHPVAPGWAAVGVLLVAALGIARPLAWLTLLPAVLPFLDFAPWTGWIVVDEFDLLVLAVIAGGHLRAALWPSSPVSRAPRVAFVLACWLGASTTAGLVIGWFDAAPTTSGWYASYVDPLNSWRVAKSMVFGLALWPMLNTALQRSAERTYERVAYGMLVGLSLVSLAVLRERIAYPGWLDFTEPYRTVAWFWEMHVGGAAIDAYLALATPFAAWAVWRARTPLRWVGAALLAMLVIHAGLTTFSRGVYLAVGVPLVWLALSLSRTHFGSHAGHWLVRVCLAAATTGALTVLLVEAQDRYGMPGVVIVLAVQFGLWLIWLASGRGRRWRRSSGLLLAAALLVEVVTVLGGGSYMVSRFTRSEHDFDSRVEHWRSGLALLHTPGDWLLGIGLGRLPAHYAAQAPGREFSGAVSWVPGPPQSAVLAGAPTSATLTGLLRLTQRVPLSSAGNYHATVVAEASKPLVLGIAVCTSHLLYASACQATQLQLLPDGSTERHVRLEGDRLQPGPAFAPREAVLVLAVLTPGAALRIHAVGLQDPSGRELLANGDFADGLAHWFPSATHYFVPWHIDNLVLELLIERGLFGLAAVAALIMVAGALPVTRAGRSLTFAPFLAASIYGLVLVGLVSSVMDAPRVALLLVLLAGIGVLLVTQDAQQQTTSPMPPV